MFLMSSFYVITCGFGGYGFCFIPNCLLYFKLIYIFLILSYIHPSDVTGTEIDQKTLVRDGKYDTKIILIE